MADMTVSYGGQVNGASTVDALFLKVFAGEVLTAFRENNVFGARTMVRNIKNGKSAQFPATWKATAAYHTPGAQVVGQVIKGNERTILIDDLLLSSVFLDTLDEAKAHFEYRSEYSYQCGASLARAMDTNIAQVLALSARASATVTGGNGGSQVVNSTAKTSADSLIASISDAVQALREKDVPQQDIYCALPWDQYFMLVNSGSKAIHTDYNPQGNGSIAEGEIKRLFGAQLVGTNNVPDSDISTGPTSYQGDFSTTAALVWHRSAAGTVKLLDLGMDMDYYSLFQGWLIAAKYAIGHGILRPESAVEIVTA